MRLLRTATLAAAAALIVVSCSGDDTSTTDGTTEDSVGATDDTSTPSTDVGQDTVLYTPWNPDPTDALQDGVVASFKLTVDDGENTTVVTQAGTNQIIEAPDGTTTVTLDGQAHRLIPDTPGIITPVAHAPQFKATVTASDGTIQIVFVGDRTVELEWDGDQYTASVDGTTYQMEVGQTMITEGRYTIVPADHVRIAEAAVAVDQDLVRAARARNQNRFEETALRRAAETHGVEIVGYVDENGDGFHDGDSIAVSGGGTVACIAAEGPRGAATITAGPCDA